MVRAGKNITIVIAAGFPQQFHNKCRYRDRALRSAAFRRISDKTCAVSAVLYALNSSPDGSFVCAEQFS